MAISKELFLALLSMDSYNRGYDQGIQNLGGLNTILGYAKIIDESDIATGTAGVTAGFYAVAYELTEAVGDMPAGTVIISYRGTDQDGELLGTDIPIFTGDYDVDQIYLASQFYHSVTAANPDAALRHHRASGAATR